MVLPTDFQFSQGSLQDYVDCPRRFHLRHVQRVAWPAVDVEPVLENERYLQQGAAFHRLVHQHELGIPAAQLAAAAVDVDLLRWWRNYLESGPADLPPQRSPEIVLSAPVGGYRLLARYDVVAVDPGRRAVIVDWKTSRRRTARHVLQARLQTRVYPFLLVEAGAQLNDSRPLAPEQVEMVYWFADYPADPERFIYNGDRHADDEATLTGLIEEIAGLDDESFPLTADESHCRYCRYRSLCRRGSVAAQMVEDGPEPDDDLLDISLDLEQIGEVVY
jgi:CRISPR/Cas system-associated exonuclease Cas4 (RecB family)